MPTPRSVSSRKADWIFFKTEESFGQKYKTTWVGRGATTEERPCQTAGPSGEKRAPSTGQNPHRCGSHDVRRAGNQVFELLLPTAGVPRKIITWCHAGCVAHSHTIACAPGAASLGHCGAQDLTKGTVLERPALHSALFGASFLVLAHSVTLWR